MLSTFAIDAHTQEQNTGHLQRTSPVSFGGTELESLQKRIKSAILAIKKYLSNWDLNEGIASMSA